MAERRKYSKKYCRYCEGKVDFLDYKDPSMFKFSLSERYKINLSSPYRPIRSDLHIWVLILSAVNRMIFSLSRGGNSLNVFLN